MFLPIALLLFFIGCVWLVIYVIKRQNKLIKHYYDGFCRKFGLTITAMGGTKLYDHPQVGGTYQGRPLSIISYVAYRRRPSTIIEVRFQNPKPWEYAIFSREESYIAYRSYSDKNKYKTNDEGFDKKFSIYSKAEPQAGFKIGAHAMNGIRNWPASVPLRLYISGPVMSTVIDDVILNDKKAKRVEDLVAAMCQLAPALEQT